MYEEKNIENQTGYEGGDTVPNAEATTPAEPATPLNGRDEPSVPESGNAIIKPRRKSPAKPAKAAQRDVEVLMSLKTKDMSPEEVAALVTYLKENNMFLNNKCQELDVTCRKTFEQLRNLDEAYNNLKLEFQNKMHYVKDLFKVAYQSVMIAGGNN